MVRDATETEYLLTHKTAEEYRSKGYEVQFEAPLDFLPSFRADLVARKGDDVRVIEVRSRSSLAADPRIAELTRLVDSKPGWSFELVLVSEPEKLESPEGARSFEAENILKRIKEAEKALQSGLPEAAFLLAWSASEAVIRGLLAARGVTSTSITSPGYVLDQGVFHGVISRDDYDAMARMRKYRNAIVHGFGVNDFSDDLATKLIGTVRSIMPTADVDDGSTNLGAH